VQGRPTFTYVELATSMLMVDSTAGSVLCAPDPAPAVNADVSFERRPRPLSLRQVGHDVEGFIRFWRGVDRRALRTRRRRKSGPVDRIIMDRPGGGRWRL
jgi:hypothetical protein